MTARTVAAAEEALVNDRFALVILDVEIAGQSGIDLLAVCKRNNAEMPVIVFSGNFDPDLPQRALAAGAVAFLHKQAPFGRIYEEVCRQLTF